MSEYADSAALTLQHPERPSIVVALHGLTGSRSQPLKYLEGFDSAAFGLFAPDLRGHGDSGFIGRPEDFTPVQLAADVSCTREVEAALVSHFLP